MSARRKPWTRLQWLKLLALAVFIAFWVGVFIGSGATP